MAVHLGDYYELMSHDIFQVNVGMIGKLVREFDFEGKVYYEIRAENYGPYMPTDTGTKKVRAWMPGNKFYAQAKDLKKNE